MSVYLRGSTYWCKFQVGGLRINESTKEKAEQAAKRYERMRRAQVEDDLRRERFGIDPRRTFGDALLEWIKAGAPKSMYSHIRNTRPHMERAPLQSSVKAALEMKQVMLKQGLSPQTVNRRLAVVRTVLNFAYKQLEWIRDPLGSRISAMMMSEKEFARHVYLTPEQVTTLLSLIKSDEVRRLVLGYCYTGARRSELLHLADGAFKNGMLSFSAATKGKKARSVPVPAHAAGVFSRLPFSCSAHLLRREFEQAREAAGLSHVRLHDLRHTYASWLAQDPDVPLTLIRDILGHSSLAVTSRYAHLRTDSSAVNSLPALGTKVDTSR